MCASGDNIRAHQPTCPLRLFANSDALKLKKRQRVTRLFIKAAPRHWTPLQQVIDAPSVGEPALTATGQGSKEIVTPPTHSLYGPTTGSLPVALVFGAEFIERAEFLLAAQAGDEEDLDVGAMEVAGEIQRE